MSIRKYGVLLLFMMCTIGLFAQELSPVAKRVQLERELNGKAKSITGLITFDQRVDKNRLSKEIKRANYFSFDKTKARELLASNASFITLNVKNDISGNTSWDLDLVEVDPTFYNFKVETSDGKRLQMSPSEGRFYRGVVRGQERESVVAFSVFPEEIIGVVSIEGEGNYNISKLDKETTHVLYNDNDLVAKNHFECGSTDDGKTDYKSEILLQSQSKTAAAAMAKCVLVYFETEYDMFQNKGSVVNVRNYVAGIFNSVATIYQNENIKTEISIVKVWTTADPYNATNLVGMRSQFQAHTNWINGDLGQLLTFRDIGGGIAAGFNGLCNSNVDQRLSVSGINTSHAIFSTYSYSVEVVAHELGHLFGSPHTHACIWNGNNTAIDGCAGKTEYGCPIPGIPSGGGTIMSYCHQTFAGINFNNGFGPQPGNLIRNRVTNASCLKYCCPTNRYMDMNVISGTFDYEAGNAIFGYLGNKISGNTNVTYDAGSVVRLLNGFQVTAGAKFNAFIDGCGGARKTDHSDTGGEITNVEAIEDQVNKEIVARLYPNPTGGQFAIEFEKLKTEAKIEVISFMGATVYSMESVTEQKVNVDLSNFAKGVYMVKISSNGKSFVKKVVYQ